MDSRSDPTEDEAARIERVYGHRATTGSGALYDPNRPEVRIQGEQLDSALESLFTSLSSGGIDQLRFLDVGCGTGGYLRKLIERGAQPALLTGTELLVDRLDQARELTREGPMWHLGDLGTLDSAATFDVVSAFTLFSSILDDSLRRTLAQQIWQRARSGGATVIFDFRYNNPKNPDVRKVTKAELRRLFPDGHFEYETMTLAPPISRRVVKLSPWLVKGLGRVPPLRSHFLFIARKPA